METLNNDIFWGEMAKYLANEMTTDEKVAFENQLYLIESEAHTNSDIRKFWDEVSYAVNYQSIDSNNVAFQNIKDTIHKRAKKHVVLRSVWMAAASLVVLVVIGLAVWQPLDNQNSSKQTLLTASTFEGLKLVQLIDGTSVDLNKGSELQYPQAFSGTTRHVKLSGEAFFNVAPNKDVPFVIEAGDITVKVLGTSFNVMAYGHKPFVEVTVEEGAVEVWVNDDKVVLHPGYRAKFDASSQMLQKSLNTNMNYNAWRTGKLVFEELPLSEVFETLNDVYSVKFDSESEDVKDMKLTARFDNKSADHIARVLALTFNLNVDFGNGKYQFRPKAGKVNR